MAYTFLYFVGVNIALNVIVLLYTLLKKIYRGVRNFFVKRKAK